MVDAQTRQLFSILAHLCTRSYLAPNRDHSYREWRCIANADEGGVWLWKNGDENEWACIIRGTQNLGELWHDLKLASASSELTSGNGWNKACREKWEVVDALLRRHVPTDAKLTISGHSLGASFAEYSFIRLRDRWDQQKLKGVTFDSSGLPDSMIANEGIQRPLPGLSICNNSFNVVNTLNKPLAGPTQFFSLGRGAAIPLHNLPKVILKVLGDTAAGIVKSVYDWHLSQHSIREIQRLIDDNEIQPSNPTTWPRYAGATLEHSPEIVTLVGGGASAWSIGMTGWGAWAGPVLVGPGGVVAGGTIVIAAVPLAATVTAAVTVSAARKMGVVSKIKSGFSRVWSFGYISGPPGGNVVALRPMRQG